MAFTAVRGARDILPSESGTWRFVERTAAELFRVYGFSEIRTPVFEKTPLFARGIGEATDIVEKEMYTFPDRKGRSLTLRPEGTAGVIRAFVQHKLHTQKDINKFFYLGPMFRYERPQAGRYRQFYQLGAEVLGDDSPYIDAEVISMVDRFFNTLDFKGYDIQINSVGCAECRPVYREVLLTYLNKDREKYCPDCSSRMDRNPLRVLDCKNKTCRGLLNGAPVIPDSLCGSCRDHFADVKKHLGALGVVYSENPYQARGLDYYTKTTFEVIYSGLGAQDAVAAGGRYNNLVSDIGGPNIPGIGFAIGLDRLVLCLEKNGGHEKWRDKPDVCFVPLGAESFDKAFHLAHMLRSEGINTLIPKNGKRSLQAQMKSANRSQSRFVIIAGEEELKRGVLLLKDMSDSSQREIGEGDLVLILKKSLVEGTFTR